MPPVRRLPFDQPVPGTGRTIGDFWTWAFSDLVANTTRSAFAEYLVGFALGAVDEGPRVSWDAVDLRYRGRAVEVKAAGLVQSWASAKPAVPRFDIASKLAWDAATNVYADAPVRAAACFVFCLHTAPAPDPLLVLDPQHWRFFVAATSLLDERYPTQRTLGLEPLRRLVEPVGFEELRRAVDVALGDAPDTPSG